MEEAAVLLPEFQQRVQQRGAVLDEPAVLRGEAQFPQGHQDLGRAFAGGDPHGLEAAVGELVLGKAVQRPVDGGGDCGLVPVSGKSLQGHSGDVRVGRGVAAALPDEGEAAVGQLAGYQQVHIPLPDGVFGPVSSAVQGQQGPAGAVDAHGDHLVIVAESLQQVVTAHVGGIPANGGDRQGQAGVFRVFPEASLVLGDVILHIQPVAVKGPFRHLASAAGQGHDRPFTAVLEADGAELIGGGLIHQPLQPSFFRTEYRQHPHEQEGAEQEGGQSDQFHACTSS